MVSATEASIVSIDIGTSSVRTLLFDASGTQVPGFGHQIPYDITATRDGGVEIDPLLLFGLVTECLDAIHAQVKERGVRPAAVAASCFWHSFLGVAADNTPTLPIVHLLDTRSAPMAEKLKRELDPVATHARVGCVFHPSYWPAKLLWLEANRRDAFRQTSRFVSFGDFLYCRLFGERSESTSMMSASGLWDQNRNDYDETLLARLPIDRSQLADPNAMDRPLSKLRTDNWPLLDGIPWYPAIGDGAANNVGAGCMRRDRFALMVGTTGAMRAVAKQPSIEIPKGLWCYRIDRERFVVGGALSDGGKVYEWMTERLAGLDDAERLEQQLRDGTPGSHGLTVLPLFAGERSPNWNAHARAAITGIGLATTPVDLLRASLEAVALRFKLIYEILRERVGAPSEVLATGGALLRSEAWTRMMADALDRPVVACLENETSSRGAALCALERLGHLRLEDAPVKLGETFAPDPAHRDAYARLLAEQQRLYGLLYP